MANPKSAYEKWRDYVNGSQQNPAAWNSYDCDIQSAVTEYNHHLAGVAGYSALNWMLIKAMAWVETGAGNPEWKRKPIQIGNPGDPGLASLLGDKEGGELILPDTLKKTLTASLAGNNPTYNIRAGIGYLLMRLANFGFKSVVEGGAEIFEVKVATGDSLDKIARKHESTVEVLRSLNPGIGGLRAGQVVKVQKASVQRVIMGWKACTTSSIAKYYNAGGDTSYAKKLDYALTLIRAGKAAVCTQ